MKKDKQYHFIYKTINIITRKYYYGMHSTDNIKDGYLGSGRRLKYSINKYGENNHKREIVEYVENRENLIEREKEIVNLNEVAKNDCLNLCVGGEGGNIRKGMKHSEKTKNKIRKSLQGKILSEETKKKISETLKGRIVIVSEETKKKISIAKKGKPSKLKGVPRTNETKKKISLGKRGKPFKKRKSLSEKTKRKISIANKGKGMKIKQLDLNNNYIKTWNSATQILNELNIDHVSDVCRGKRKSAGKFRWEYA